MVLASVRRVVGMSTITFALGVAACGSGEPGAATSTTQAAPYSFNNFKCLADELPQDSGRTLVMDLAAPAVSDDDGFGHTYMVECVRMVTRLPDYVREQMNQTTALQGRQTAEWSVESSEIPEAQLKAKPMANATLSASWTYHPDNGLDVIFTVKA
ncbi:MAG TPA: hypothetical protein VES42_20040 [Pilimelia sp.]|nr:hypothetical protein [Pilimelia sp.]